MHASLQRRINVANCWATSRIAVLDTQERYEDSYAIAEEFREWITCIGEDPEYLEASVLKVPQTLNSYLHEETSESDEMLEI